MTDRQITVIGRIWWDGYNNYHSCEVYVNGDLIERRDFTIGINSLSVEQTALKILVDNKIYEPGDHNTRSLWVAVEDNNDTKIVSVTDVKRKKDM